MNAPHETPQIVSIIECQELRVAFYIGNAADAPAEFWSNYDLYLLYDGPQEADLLTAIQSQGPSFDMQAWIDAQ